MEKLYQIFISSTYTDLIDERAKVKDSISKSGHIPAGMESFPASNQKQFDYIKRIIDRCDYYVLIIAGRYGSLNAEDISYTEAEYEYAEHIGIPVLTFLHETPDKIESGKTEKDPKFAAKLMAFRKRVSNGRLVDHWNSPDELATKVTVALIHEMNLNPRVGWVRGDQALDADIFRELEKLRSDAAAAKEDSDESAIKFPSWMPDIQIPIEISVDQIIKADENSFGETIPKKKIHKKITISPMALFFVLSKHIGSGLREYSINHSISKSIEELLIEERDSFISISTDDEVCKHIIDRFVGYNLIEEFLHTSGEQNTLRRYLRLTTKGRNYQIQLKFQNTV